MKIEDIKLGETYYFPYKSDQIYVFKVINENYKYNTKSNIGGYCIFNNYEFNLWENITDITDFLSVNTRLATKEESEHLEQCIAANKYVDYYKPTQDEINLNNLIEQSKNLIFKT